jgi:hypothetical protein
MSTQQYVDIWRERIPMINRIAEDLLTEMAQQGAVSKKNGLLVERVRDEIFRREARTLGLKKPYDQSTINAGLKAVWDQLGKAAHAIHIHVDHPCPKRRPSIVPLAEPQKFKFEPDYDLKQSCPENALEPLPQSTPDPLLDITPEALAESFVALIAKLSSQISVLESENQAQADLLSEAGETQERCRAKITKLEDEVERLQQKRGDLSQRLAGAIAMATPGD